jgi:hypothetical protein
MGRATVVTVLVVLMSAAAAPGQPGVEFVQRGATDPAVVAEARQATLYSLEVMASVGATLTARPLVYFAATKADCTEIHLEHGWARSEGERRGERRCDLFAGMTFPGVFVVNIAHIHARQRDPVGFMWWLIPYELFHLYQWQAGPAFWRNTPLAFQEAPADMFKFQILHQRRLIVMDAYVRRTLMPRARAARERWGFSILHRVPLDQSNTDDFYTLAGVLGYSRYLNGGWPRLVALNSGAAFRQNVERLYERTPEALELEFYGWLDTQ